MQVIKDEKSTSFKKKITIGSLFDGSGGFPLAGVLNGAIPLWASEIEPYPIAVTRSRFPNMKHLGSVTDIHGGDIEPVDIVTFGSPCQDMSVAGKRAGMQHSSKGDESTTRSGLFFEAVRIIREMREKTNGEYPKYAIWENVPGAFTSNKGEDFKCVLEELFSICEEKELSIPKPNNGKWSASGEILGDKGSIAWRVLDAQYWGVPQRRRRIYLVADFTDGRAGKILFERESMSGNSSQGRAARKGTAADAERCANGSCQSGCMNPWDSQSERIYGLDATSPTLSANASGGQNRQGICYPMQNQDKPPVYSIDQQGGKGMASYADSVNCTLCSDSHGTPHAVCYSIQRNGIDRASTLRCNGCGWRTDKMYTSNTIDCPAVAFMAGQGAKAHGVGAVEDGSPTLKGCPSGLNQIPSVVYPEIHPSLTATNAANVESAQRYNGVVYPVALHCYTATSFAEYKEAPPTLRASGSDCGGGSEGIVVYPDVARCLTAESDASPCLDRGQNVVALDCRNLNESSVSGTLQAKTTGGYSLNYQNPVVYDVRGNGNGKDVPTLTGDHENRITDYTSVVCAATAQTNAEIMVDMSPTLVAGHEHPIITYDSKPSRRYIVRRLTPTECARLQGFPDCWGIPDQKERMTEDELSFWHDVRELYATANGKKYRKINDNALLKWYNKLHTDSAEYKMWGNGIALPCAEYVVGGVVEAIVNS